LSQLLEVRNLSIGIKKDGNIFNAVNSVNFSVNEGEISGIAGESGCGKSLTALSILNLLPDAAKMIHGEIIFDSKIISDNRSINRSLTSINKKNKNETRRVSGREISMIFQETRQSLNPLLKVGSQITETLEIAGNTDRAKNRIAVLEMLETLGFDEPEKIFKAYPHQLSGGMCQRVMAAIAAIDRPRLLIADEPSSALDEDSQNRILSLLAKMNSEYKTPVIIISHDLSIIQKFCSRFIVMYAGRIVEEGPSISFFSPLHPYTKALVMAIPDKDKRGKKLTNIPGKVPSIEDSLSGCPFAPRCKKTQGICLEYFPPAREIGEKQKVHCYFPETGGASG